jgi:methylmalonyl-CoA/ethylmalonyl-CoA epimerase
VIRGVHHIGIAVHDLEAAMTFYERAFDLQAEVVESPPGSTLRFAMIRLPGAEIELMAPAAEHTPISTFLARRGPGVHHIAFGVDDIRSAMAATSERGVQLLDAEPAPGVEDTLTCFFHPRTTLGVLYEYVQPAERADGREVLDQHAE